MGFLSEWHDWLKALHVISVIAWMAGMLYLPRLFVYHADAAPGSELSETFKVMECRLLRAIMNPAMIATWVFGVLMLLSLGWDFVAGSHWLHVKLLLVLGMTWHHHALATWRKDFDADQNVRSARFYRVMNEAPTVLLIGIVVLVIVRPF